MLILWSFICFTGLIFQLPTNDRGNVPVLLRTKIGQIDLTYHFDVIGIYFNGSIGSPSNTYILRTKVNVFHIFTRKILGYKLN